jgi:ComF family protein
MLQDFLQGIKELVFPDNCFLCRSYLHSSHQKQLCDQCLSSLPMNRAPFCLQCSRHLSVFTEQGLCSSCLSSSPLALDNATCACLYEEPLPDLLYAFKYHGKTHLRKLFSRLLIEHIDTYHLPIHQFDLIIPIPLHPTRLRERGFNQAALLSAALAQHYQRPHRTDILIRTKLTPSQTQYQAKQRWTNVHDAFRINSFTDIADKHVLIVDDLITTAATVNAASACLKNNGAAYVGALSLAITS